MLFVTVTHVLPTVGSTKRSSCAALVIYLEQPPSTRAHGTGPRGLPVHARCHVAERVRDAAQARVHGDGRHELRGVGHTARSPPPPARCATTSLAVAEHRHAAHHARRGWACPTSRVKRLCGSPTQRSYAHHRAGHKAVQVRRMLVRSHLRGRAPPPRATRRPLQPRGRSARAC